MMSSMFRFKPSVQSDALPSCRSRIDGNFLKFKTFFNFFLLPQKILPERLFCRQNLFADVPLSVSMNSSIGTFFIFDKINDKRLTHFILKNLKRENNSFSWKINIEVISNELQNILNEDYNKKINNQATLYSYYGSVTFFKSQKRYFI